MSWPPHRPQRMPRKFPSGFAARSSSHARGIHPLHYDNERNRQNEKLAGYNASQSETKFLSHGFFLPFLTRPSDIYAPSVLETDTAPRCVTVHHSARRNTRAIRNVCVWRTWTYPVTAVPSWGLTRGLLGPRLDLGHNHCGGQ